MQVYWCRDEAELLERIGKLGGAPFLFQKPVMESLGRDVRVNVVGDRAAAAMLRHSQSGDFRSNLTIGGTMEPHALTREEETLAVRATQALGLDFAGVDLLFGAGKGEDDLCALVLVECEQVAADGLRALSLIGGIERTLFLADKGSQCFFLFDHRHGNDPPDGFRI